MTDRRPTSPQESAQHQAASLLRPAATRTPPPRRAPWISVAGGKGGVGKTLISVNLALLAARAGRRVLLVDFDPGLANVAVHMRLAPHHDLVDLIERSCSPAEAVVDGPCGVRVLCGRSGDATLAGGSASGVGTELGVRRALAAIEEAAAAVQADLVLVDCGAGIGPTVLHAAARSALTLCVTTPEPSALTDAYALIKVLHGEKPNAAVALTINNVRSRDEAVRISGRLQQVTQRFLGIEPGLAGWLRTDPVLAMSVAEQRPAALGSGPFLEDLRALLAATLSHVPSRRTAATGSSRTATPATVSRTRTPAASPTRGATNAARRTVGANAVPQHGRLDGQRPIGRRRPS